MREPGERPQESTASTRTQQIATALLMPRVFLLAGSVPGLVRLPFSALEALLEPRRPPSRADPATVERVAGCVERVLRLGRPWVGAGCLTRGITRYYFLRRAGLDLRLCFGAGLSPGGELTGHCWLELSGDPFLEEADPRTAFVEMHRIPSPSPHRA